jgi:hypothetical protein
LVGDWFFNDEQVIFRNVSFVGADSRLIPVLINRPDELNLLVAFKRKLRLVLLPEVVLALKIKASGLIKRQGLPLLHRIE